MANEVELVVTGRDPSGTATLEKVRRGAESQQSAWAKFRDGVVKTAGAIGLMVTAKKAWDVTLGAGFVRLADLEDANKRLAQMGLTTQQIDGLMSGLNDTLTGTPFKLNEGASAIAQFVAAGMPIDEVNKRFAMTADTAAFAQAPLSEIAGIFGDITSEGKLTGEALNMLQERGVPALTLLASAAGVTAEEMREMISGGAIDAETFFALWEQGAAGFGESNIKMQGAAKSMGDTTRGAMANMLTSFQRAGAEVLDVTGGFDALAGVFRATGEAADGAAGVVSSVVGFLADNTDVARALAVVLATMLIPRMVAFGTAAVVAAGKAVAGFLSVQGAALKANASLGVLGLALGALTLGFSKAAETSGDLVRGTNEVAASLKKLEDGKADEFIGKARDSIKEFDDNVRILGVDMSTSWKPEDWFGGGTRAAKEFDEAVASVDSGMASLVSSGDIETTEEAIGAIAEVFDVSRDRAEQLLEKMPQVREALAGLGDAADTAAPKVDELANIQGKIAGVAEMAAEAQSAASEKIAESAATIAESWETAVSDVADANQAYSDGLAELEEDQELTTEAFIEQFEKRVKAAQEFNENIVAIQKRTSDEVFALMEEDLQKNPELADMIANATGEEFSKIEDLYRESASAANEAANREFINNMPTLQTIAANSGSAFANKLAGKIKSGGKLTVIEVNKIMRDAKDEVEATELAAAIDPFLDENARDAVERRLNSLARTRDVYFRPIGPGPGGFPRRPDRAHGGVVGAETTSMAHGGVAGQSEIVVNDGARPEAISTPNGSLVIPSLDQAFDRNQLSTGDGLTINIYVQGSIRSDRDLVELIRDEMLNGGFRGALEGAGS